MNQLTLLAVIFIIINYYLDKRFIRSHASYFFTSVMLLAKFPFIKNIGIIGAPVHLISIAMAGVAHCTSEQASISFIYCCNTTLRARGMGNKEL